MTRRVAMLLEHGFDDPELAGTAERLRAAGLEIVFVAPHAARQYRGLHGHVATSDAAAGSVHGADFHAIVIPGGHAPDRLRMRPAMCDLVRLAVGSGRIVAAICRGPQLLISADVLRGRTLTCWPSIAVDVRNAGGLYVDRPVVEDGPLITSRKSDDVPLFAAAILRALAPGQ